MTRARLALAAVALYHVAALLAGFLAPYDYAAQNRDLPYAPPTRLHFVDRQGKLHLRPFVYRRSGPPYEENTSVTYPLRFWVQGAPYKIAGLITSRTRLLGVDEPARLLLLGSDAYGRDQFSRLLYGSQVSLLAGLVAAALALALALGLGALAGYCGGWLDAVLMRLSELFVALPWLYLLLAVRAFLPLHIAPFQAFLLVVLVIGAIGWARPARLVRGLVLSAKERGYVLAARGFGASPIYLLWRHVLPETYGVLATQAAILIPHYILAEVTMSFFGLGMSEPAASWGNLLAALTEYHVLDSYWWMLLPALGMLPVFLAYYVLADSLRPRGAVSSA